MLTFLCARSSYTIQFALRSNIRFEITVALASQCVTLFDWICNKKYSEAWKSLNDRELKSRMLQMEKRIESTEFHIVSLITTYKCTTEQSVLQIKIAAWCTRPSLKSNSTCEATQNVQEEICPVERGQKCCSFFSAALNVSSSVD